MSCDTYIDYMLYTYWHDELLIWHFYLLCYVITGTIGKKYLKNISRVRANTAMRRRKLFSEGTKRKKLHLGAPDKEYGLAEPLIETISEEHLNEKKNWFY